MRAEKRTFSTDDRGLSVTINHILALGITSMLMVGLFASTGEFVGTQVDSAGEHELTVIGNRIAAEISVADRLAKRGGEVSLRLSQPPKIASGTYSVDVETGSACDTASFTSDTCLRLVSGERDISVKVPVSNSTDISIREPRTGEFLITADPSGTAADSRGGAGSGVGINIGIGANASQPTNNGKNVSLSNQPPVAKFRFSPGSPTHESIINFTAVAATDADGNIVAYRWDVDGDGSIEQRGRQFNYSYAAPGKYNATLTVKDDDGDTDTTSKIIVVSGIVYNDDVVATDEDRDGTTGALQFSVTNEHGDDATITHISIDPYDDDIGELENNLPGRGVARTEMYVKSGGGGNGYVEAASGIDIPPGGRIVDMDTEAYTTSDNPEIGAGSSADVYFVEFRRTGGGPRDVDMSNKKVDVAVRYHVDGEYFVSKFTLNEHVNTPPDPDFSVSCTGKTCSFDGSASNDPDGSLSKFNWSFDDGTFASGQTATHTYPANGTYKVSLTVTDDDGTSAAVTKQVAVGTIAFDVRVNFQPAGETTPSGYVADTGAVYGARGNGYTYGWKQPADATRDRDERWYSQRYETFTHMDDAKYGSDRTWELQVPNARYRVTIAMGDPSYVDQINTVNIEGTRIADPDPYNSYHEHLDRYTATVDVTDGKLSVKPGGGSYNAKVMWIHVEAVDQRPYEQDGGRVVVEAEHYQQVHQGNDRDDGPDDAHDMEGVSFIPVDDSAASGGDAIYATPNRGFNAQDTENGQRLDYRVDFSSTGTHYVWVRMRCANYRDDSVHVGLDGQPESFGGYGLSYGCDDVSGYTWVNRVGGSPVTMHVSSTGTHTVNLWMREDGVYVDKIVVTTDPSFNPTGEGPEESDQ